MHWWRSEWTDTKLDTYIERDLIKRIFSYFLPYWRHSIVVFAAIGAGAVLGVIPSILTQKIIDTALPGQGHKGDLHLLIVFVGLMIAAPIAAGFISLLQSYFNNMISQGIMYDLRKELFERLLEQSFNFFTNTRIGDIISRFDNDIGGIQTVVSDTIFNFVSNLMIVATTLAVMVGYSWPLTCIAVIVVPAFVYPTRKVGQAMFRARRDTQSKLAEMSVYLQEIFGISGILLVKTFVRKNFEELRFKSINAELKRLQLRQTMIGRWFFMLLNILGSAGPAIIWLAGGYMVIKGEISIGTIVAFIALLTRLYGPVGQIANLHVNIKGSLALFQRIFTYMDEPPLVKDGHKDIYSPDSPCYVEFCDVSFKYPASRKWALRHVSFEIRPGQMVALVGPTGAGKTTIAYLLCRLYDPQEGKILINQVDLRDATLESIGKMIGFVNQDPFLFHATVRENLLYANPQATEDEMLEALEAANLIDVIDALPKGLDTLVGERGYRFSGGEKQRFAIARVFLKKPQLIILDEATSHLDTESERLIQAALNRLLIDRTSLVIAHRLSTILMADKIVVLDKGRIVEEGTHASLLQSGKLYASLYMKQFQLESA